MDCSICCDPLKESIKVLRCSHSFHSDCIMDWIKDFHWTCPLCRQGIFEVIVKKSNDTIFPIHIDGKEYFVQKEDYWKVRVDLNLVPYQGDSELYKTYESQIVGIVFFALIKNEGNIELAKEDVRKVLEHR
jgi:hypothetical protein